MAGSEDSKSELHTLKKRPHVVRHFILAALLLVLSAVSLFAWQAVRRDGLNDELRSAVRTGDEAKVKELLESGADATRLIRKKDESSFNLWERITGKVHPSSDARQARPILLTACTIGNGAIVRDLLKHGADKNYIMPDGRTPLHYAAVKQGSKALVVLLESGLNPNVQDKKGRTALHIAAENASPDNCLVLLSHRASISIKDYCNYTPMRYAIAKPSPKVVLAMLEHGADMKEFEIESVDKLTDKGRGKSNGGGIHGGGLRGDQPEAVASLPLSWAARNGDSEVLKYVYSRLENSKTNSMLYDAFCAAIDAKHRDNAEFLLSQGLKLSESVPSANAANPLSTAFYQNNLKLMKYLIKIGHPINPPASDNGAKDKQNSPLFDVSQSIHYNQGICYASYGMISGKEKILEIKSSQDSNLKNILYISLSQDYEKQKLQQESIQKPKDDAAQLLIDNGANVDCSNADGDTALFFVTSRSRLVKRFLEKGANVHARNKSGDTVLMYCKNMSPESCELLIKAGADVNARCKNGFSPLIAAVESCNVAVARVLLKHGADPTKTNYRGKTPYEIGGAIGFPPMKKVFEEAKIKR